MTTARSDDDQAREDREERPDLVGVDRDQLAPADAEETAAALGLAEAERAVAAGGGTERERAMLAEVAHHRGADDRRAAWQRLSATP